MRAPVAPPRALAGGGCDIVLFVDGARVFSRDAGSVTFDPVFLARARTAIAELGRILKGFR